MGGILVLVVLNGDDADIPRSRSPYRADATFPLSTCTKAMTFLTSAPVRGERTPSTPSVPESVLCVFLTHARVVIAKKFPILVGKLTVCLLKISQSEAGTQPPSV